VADRIEKRDVPAIIRAVDQETLLKALSGAEENAPKTREFILTSISSRIAEQLTEELADYGKVKIREAEEAQTEFLRIIRELESAGELQLIELDD
jgi:flagellar motor switch protein FliG